MIDLTPSIDWSTQHVVMETTAGVLHYPVDKDKLSPNYVIIQQQYSSGGYYIEDKGRYLSIRLYHTPDGCGRVCDYKSLVTGRQGDVTLRPVLGYVPWSYRGDTSNIAKNDSAELRIYKNRSMLIVRHAVVDRPIAYVQNIFTDGRVSFPIPWGDTVKDTDLAQYNATEVTNELEIDAYATPVRVKDLGMLKSGIPDYYSDLAGRDHPILRYYNSCGGGRFNNCTQDLVENFFGCTDEDKKYIKQGYNKKQGYVDANRTPSINTIYDILTWCVIPANQNSQVESKQIKAEELLAPFAQYWNNMSHYPSHVIWGRDGDNITAIMGDTTANRRWYYRYGSDSRKLFSYNVKTKKRFYGELSPSNIWTFPIPSLKYITAAMELTPEERSKHDTTSKITTIIKDGISVQELFAGSNVGWALDNMPDNCMMIPERFRGESIDCSITDLVPVKEYIRDDRIGNIAISMLVTTGTPVLEQLLKSNLYNIYFHQLWHMANDETYSAPVFWDLDNPPKNKSLDNSMLAYHSKEKNLRKMFGMSLNMLREIDAALAFSKRTSTNWRGESHIHWERQTFKLTKLENALDTPINLIDLDTFKELLQISINANIARTSRNIWDAIDDTFVNSKMTPKQIIDIIKKYMVVEQSDGSIIQNTDYLDYIRMRDELQETQARMPEVPDIFSDKRYPIKPGNARKFIAFHEGTIDEQYPWTRTTLTPEGFLKRQKRDYAYAEQRGDIQESYDTNGKLLGVTITMTPYEHSKFLHNDASFWVRYYADTKKDKEFREAVKRVKPLEWEDTTMKLRITAPTCIADLKKEATVLDHCVASYVTPIIDGKDNVVFIRRTDIPDDPFYTVDVSPDGDIRQVHCYRNGSLTSDAQKKAYADTGYAVYDTVFDLPEFLRRWAKAMHGRINMGSIKSVYSIMGALR